MKLGIFYVGTVLIAVALCWATSENNAAALPIIIFAYVWALGAVFLENRL